MAGDPRLRSRRRRLVMAQVRAEEPNCHLCEQGPIDLTLDRQRHPLGSVGDEVTPREFGGDPEDRANVRHAHRICNELRGVALLTPGIRDACRAAYRDTVASLAAIDAAGPITPDDELSRRW